MYVYINISPLISLATFICISCLIQNQAIQGKKEAFKIKTRRLTVSISILHSTMYIEKQDQIVIAYSEAELINR